jgi:N6-L-threonylcarbamoyladenine synthase
MRVLGIESSCDETAAAVVEINEQTHVCRLLSNTVVSQIDIHKAYGGVVPEIAARSHIEAIIPVINQALKQSIVPSPESPALDSGLKAINSIDAIAVTYGAGLGGSLLVGVMTARSLAIALNKPLYAINHVEAHVYANFITEAGSPLPASRQSLELRKGSSANTAFEAPLLGSSSRPTATSATHSGLVFPRSPASVSQWKLENELYSLPTSAPKFPILALIVSGGHTQLILFEDHFDYKILGKTQDDAIGEAFDKVAKMTGLPYPGGPSVAAKAKDGDPYKFNFPKANVDGDFNFSFSGLKTAVLRTAQGLTGHNHTMPSTELPGLLSDAQKADLAASFQRVAIETIVDKTILAYEQYSPTSVIIAGGVASSDELRRQLTERLPISIEYTDRKLCTDNASMIATLGCFKAISGQTPADPYTLEINPSLKMLVI